MDGEVNRIDLDPDEALKLARAWWAATGHADPGPDAARWSIAWRVDATGRLQITSWVTAFLPLNYIRITINPAIFAPDSKGGTDGP